MIDTRVSSRYALSLFNLANENAVLETVKNDMELVKATLSSSRDLNLILKSPIINNDKKIAILSEIFEKSIQILSFSFIKILVVKGREFYLESISSEFLKLYKKHKNILTATIVSATKLDNAAIEKVKSIIKTSTNSTIELIEEVKPEIMGGFILNIGDKQIDSSIKTKIQELRREFSSNHYESKL